MCFRESCVLSKLVNAYSRLLERTKEDKDSESSVSDYYEKIEKECFGEMLIS
jgi:hypothetical protein